MTTPAIDPATDVLRPVNVFVRATFGKPASPATRWRWRLKGVNGVKLPMVRFGSEWCTTEAAFAEFVRAQTANCSPATLDTDAPTERSAATQKKLAAAGLI